MKKMYLVAIISALICEILTFAFLGNLMGNTGGSGQQKEVLVVSQDIPAYKAVTEDMFVKKKLPAQGLREDVVTDFEQIKGKKSSCNYVAGETLVLSKFSTDLEEYASYNVPEGMRVMTVPVENTSGLAQSLTKGDLVDVMFSAFDENKDSEASLYQDIKVKDSVTSMILESVEVFDTGSAMDAEGAEYTTVSILLTPEDCLKLYASENYGTFSFVLRGHTDVDPANPANVKANKIL